MCSQWFSHTGFAPAHGVCAFPVYTAKDLGCSAGNCLIRALCCMHSPGLSHSGSGSRVFHKGAHLVGPVFCACPRSEQLRQPGAWQAQSPLVEGCILSPTLSQLLDFLGVQQVRLLRCAVCLFQGADLWLWPSWQMLTVQNTEKSWLAKKSACSLVDNASLGLWLPLLSLAALTCLSLAKDGLVCSQLPLLSPLFCEPAWQCLRLGLLRDSYPTVWIAISS